MKNECFEYALHIAKELESIYNGENDEFESVFDYTADALDVEYILDSRREFIGAHIYVTLGGPTCWIDTRWNTVECVWGGDKASVPIFGDVCDEINDLYSEMF